MAGGARPPALAEARPPAVRPAAGAGSAAFQARAQEAKELAKKREEETARRAEYTSANTVRKVIQKIRVVQPDNFDNLRAELEQTLHDQLEKMGSHAEKVQQEAEKELLEAQMRIDTLVEKRAEDERKKAEAEVKRVTQKEKADTMVKDASALVLEAEQKVESAARSCTELEELNKSKSGSADEALKKAASAEDSAGVAKVSIDGASKALGASLAAADLPLDLLANVKKEYKALSSKISTCRQSLSKFTALLKEAKEKEARRANAAKFEQDQKALFAKFDTKGRGHLSPSDVQKFAKEVYSFDLAKDALERIHTKLKGDSAGIPVEAFQRMRGKVAVERSCVLARAQRAKEEELKAEIEKKKNQFKELTADAEAALKGGQEALVNAETLAKALACTSAKTLSSSEIRESCSKAETAVSGAKTALDQASKHIEAISSSASAGDLQDEVAQFQKKVTDDFHGHLKRAQASMERSANVIRAARGRLQRMECSEVESLRLQVVRSIGDFMDTKEFDLDKLYEHMKGGGSSVSADSFVAFIKELHETAGDKLDSGDAGKHTSLFACIAGSSAELSLQQLTEMLHCTYKVVKPTMFSDGKAIDSTGLRRLDEGEHVQGLGCPSKDKSGVLRVKCKAMKDDLEGWASVMGNKGSAFLQPCSKFMVCVKETVITDELNVSSDTVRKLNKDELLEVLQFPTKDPNCSIVRIKTKVLGDGAVGWVSTSSNTGTPFLEAL